MSFGPGNFIIGDAQTFPAAAHTVARHSVAADMRHQIPIRIRVLRPLAEVAMKVQRGKNELLAPVAASPDELVFEFEITVDLTETQPNFLGKYAQGPRTARFVYVNSGSYAGQPGTCWDRRAKIALVGITREQVEQAAANGSFLSTEFEGIGRDGGPTCASVKGITWRIEKRPTANTLDRRNAV